MKTGCIVCVGLLASLCTAGQSVFAQYSGMPYAVPGYGPAAPILVPPAYGMPPMMAQGMVLPASANQLVPPAIPGPIDAGDAQGAADCDGKTCSKCVKCSHECGCGVSVYGEFLYLRPRDAEVAYAVNTDGPATNASIPIQISPIGVTDMDFQPAFRFGFLYHVDACNAVGAEYMHFEGSTTDEVITSAPPVIQTMVIHPSTLSAARNWLQANADLDHSFDLVDVHYTNLFYCDESVRMSMLAGLRLVQHEQEFQANFAGTGQEVVRTDIDFYGAGARLGLNLEKYLTCRWLVYAKGNGSLVPGVFDAQYRQGQAFDPQVVDTSWEAGRLVTIWDLELGTSWTSKCGYYRFSAGYVFSAWTNMVQTDEWIQGVRRNNFIDMDSTMTYDGLVARAEVRF